MEFAWFGIVLGALLLYICLDGFDLGLGILTLFEKDPHRRHEMVEGAADVWGANETFVVLADVGPRCPGARVGRAFPPPPSRGMMFLQK